MCLKFVRINSSLGSSRDRGERITFSIPWIRGQFKSDTDNIYIFAGASTIIRWCDRREDAHRMLILGRCVIAPCQQSAIRETVCLCCCICRLIRHFQKRNATVETYQSQRQDERLDQTRTTERCSDGSMMRFRVRHPVHPSSMRISGFSSPTQCWNSLLKDERLETSPFRGHAHRNRPKCARTSPVDWHVFACGAAESLRASRCPVFGARTSRAEEAPLTDSLVTCSLFPTCCPHSLALWSFFGSSLSPPCSRPSFVDRSSQVRYGNILRKGNFVIGLKGKRRFDHCTNTCAILFRFRYRSACFHFHSLSYE